MLRVSNVKVDGFESAIRGMRNPMNSWNRSDSYFGDAYLEREDNLVEPGIGPNDLDLMRRLAKSGTDHRKFLRMITVWMDINAPLYWWKEFDTYKVGTVANSCSTMHKIQAKEFTVDDFSIDHILDGEQNEDRSYYAQLCVTIEYLNRARQAYLETKDKSYWWKMIQLLPSSYNQKRTVMLNYEVAANMYFSRKDHKLDEWHVLCDSFKNLPYFKDIFSLED